MAPTTEKENSSPVLKQIRRMQTGGMAPTKRLAKKPGQSPLSAFHLWLNDEDNKQTVLDHYEGKSGKKMKLFKKAGFYWRSNVPEAVKNKYQKLYLEEKANLEREK